MVFAHQKYLSGAAEYLLFMWQMEDLVRAVNFDVEALDGFIKTLSPDEESQEAERKWFQGLIKDMKAEKLEKRGHLTVLEEILAELTYLHQTLLKVWKDAEYIQMYEAARPNLEEYISRSKGVSQNEVELCLHALYGLLVLRLRREPISAETESAMGTFSQLLASLSAHYFKMKQGDQKAALN
jgi:hypothetical protein